MPILSKFPRYRGKWNLLRDNRDKTKERINTRASAQGTQETHR